MPESPRPEPSLKDIGVSASSPAPEPRFARIAATIGDATRARTLARLLDGRHYTATELAAHAGVSAATMSGHLKLLVDEHLVTVRAQGRHRFFTLADSNVAHALEALLRVADSAPLQALRWQRPAQRIPSSLRHARSCYGHLAGELGVKLHDAMVKMNWVEARAPDINQYSLTTAGLEGFNKIGMDMTKFALILTNKPRHQPHSSSIQPSPRHLYGCMDWSERRDHFAGPLAVAILAHFLAQKWLTRENDSRELRITATGQKTLNETFFSQY